MFSMSSSGSTKRTQKFLRTIQDNDIFKGLESLARSGVDALSSATPVDSGLTADSWDYEIVINKGSVGITWLNYNQNKGERIAILLQYGHGTGTGGYVAGQDYINPAIRPVFDRIADEAWKAVTSA